MALQGQEKWNESFIHYLTKDPDEEWNSIVYNWPLLSSPKPTILTSFVFILVVKFIGPHLMKERKAFNIKPIIILYNLIMVVLNMWMVSQFLTLGWLGKYSFKCQPFDRTLKGMPMNYVSYIYFLSKFVDLIDTLFFVMTKKFSHITWLHLIHHSSMPIYCYMGMRLAPNGHGTSALLLNSLVHVVMYAYYGLACCGDRVKPFLWWKKYITQMQLLQFLMIFVHSCSSYFRKDCDFPPHAFYIYSIIFVSFTILFSNFYIQQYVRSMKETIVKKDKTAHVPDFVKNTDENNNDNNQVKYRKTIAISTQ